MPDKSLSRPAPRPALLAVVALLMFVAGGGTLWWLDRSGHLPAALSSHRTEPVPATTAGPTFSDAVCNGGKVLHYRNPMGLPDTSPVPKKDSMDMDYIPVCADDAPAESNTVKVSLDRVQRLGVRTAAIGPRKLSRTVRAFATVQFDERRQVVIAPRYAGWISKLHVSAAGDRVERGQPLFEVYSPDLNVLQMEYLNALPRGGDAGATEDRARTLEFPDAELNRLKQGGKVARVIAIPSPVTGTVIDKPAIQGMRFAAGDTLFRIVDTSSMWVMAQVFEQDLAYVKVGDTAEVAIAAYPGRTFTGRVAFIYPAIGADTRAARLRIEVANPDGALRAEMTATIDIASPLPDEAIAVPESAVIDSGRRQVVLVDRGEGRFEPRAVTLGARVPGWIQVTSGLSDGERVVISATFLIDAESNLRTALGSFATESGQ